MAAAHLHLWISQRAVGDRASLGPVGQRCIRLLHSLTFLFLTAAAACTHYNSMQLASITLHTELHTANTMCKSHGKRAKMCKSGWSAKVLVQRQFPACACSVTGALLRHPHTHRRNHRRCTNSPPNLFHNLYKNTQIQKKGAQLFGAQFAIF